MQAGHLLGSASVQLAVEENGRKKSVVFSGDLGQSAIPFTRHANLIERADAVFLESTYGDRDHKPFQETADEFTEIVARPPDGQSAAENLAVLRRRPRPFAFGPIDSGAFSNPARNYPGTGKRWNFEGRSATAESRRDL